MEESVYHVPVLLEATVDGLGVTPGGIYADMTFGGGGHSREILRRLGSEGRLFAFDQDADAERNIPADGRLTFVRSNFRYLANWMRYHGIEKLDGVVADLGVSSHHFDAEERGFSFRFQSKLDMRMNQRAGLTAAQVLNTYDEERLATLFYLYGELKNGRKLAAAIVKRRATAPFVTTEDVIETVKPYFGRVREKKEMAKVFQALRIEVNGEMRALRQMQEAATRILRPGGRLVILTYHSLEDRMVKNIMRAGNPEGRVEQDMFGRIMAPLRPVGKMIVPTAKEQNENPRSRSAKLRIAEKMEDTE